MNEHIVLRTMARVLFPFILMYGLYVQFHGEYSPGGGFQAGVICAAAFIVYGLVHDLQAVQSVFPSYAARVLSAIGLLLYIGVGVAGMLKGGHFLDYHVLAADAVQGQQLGIMLVELGVGLTVFSVIMLFFYTFGERSS